MSFSLHAAIASVARQGNGVTIARNAEGGTLSIIPGKLTVEEARAQQSADSKLCYGVVVSVEYTPAREKEAP
jgi:hypothetical protein